MMGRADLSHRKSSVTRANGLASDNGQRENSSSLKGSLLTRSARKAPAAAVTIAIQRRLQFAATILEARICSHQRHLQSTLQIRLLVSSVPPISDFRESVTHSLCDPA